MKRLSLIFIIFVCALTTMAQDYLGFQLGYARSISRLNSPENKTVFTSTPYDGFKLGLLYDATIIKGFGVTLGLNYTFGISSTDWVKLNDKQLGLYPQVCSKALYHQLELPVEWQYKFEIAKETWIIVYTGPTIQCGLSLTSNKFETDNYGKIKDGVKSSDIYSTEDMKDYALKRINVTWGVGAGFQFQRYFLRGGYDFGVINPYKAYQFDKVVDGGNPRTRGHFDQWQIKLGMYLWQF